MASCIAFSEAQLKWPFQKNVCPPPGNPQRQNQSPGNFTTESREPTGWGGRECCGERPYGRAQRGDMPSWSRTALGGHLDPPRNVNALFRALAPSRRRSHSSRTKKPLWMCVPMEVRSRDRKSGGQTGSVQHKANGATQEGLAKI
jgi:hypothetical protein